MTFKRKEYIRPERALLVPLNPEVTAALQRQDGRARLTVPVPRPKEGPVRDESYRRLVASWDCIQCGKAGPSQFAHSDEGKGMGIKSCDLTGYPACADAPGRPGCHSVIGSQGMYTQAQRRRLEAGYAETTRRRAASMGKLPVKGEK